MIPGLHHLVIAVPDIEADPGLDSDSEAIGEGSPRRRSD
jgi:hypothetical protein